MNVLLVEDDVGIGRMVSRGLRAAGHDVDWALSGRDCLARAAAGRYHALILDLMLPDMDGLQVCTSLRAAANPLPILILSARDSIQNRVEGLDAGGDDYLTKPFAFDELLARLRALQRRIPPADIPGQIEVGDLVLLVDSNEVVADGRRICLTQTEFRLLECLARRRGRVVSRSQLIAGVWAGEGEVTDNVLDVYVRYLRKKLDAGQNPSRIATIRGIGFKLN